MGRGGGATGLIRVAAVREPVAKHLSEIENALRSEAEAIHRGELHTRSLDEVATELGLD